MFEIPRHQYEIRKKRFEAGLCPEHNVDLVLDSGNRYRCPNPRCALIIEEGATIDAETWIGLAPDPIVDQVVSLMKLVATRSDNDPPHRKASDHKKARGIIDQIVQSLAAPDQETARALLEDTTTNTTTDATDNGPNDAGDRRP